MCQSKADGGRRCQTCNTPVVRSSRTKAHTAATKSPEGGIGRGGTQDPTSPPERTWNPQEARAFAHTISRILHDQTHPPMIQDWGTREDGTPYPIYSPEDQAREDANQAFLDQHGGTIEGVVRALGSQVAAEAERRAGVTAEDVEALSRRDRAAAEDALAAAHAAHAAAEKAAAPLREATKALTRGKGFAEVLRMKREDPTYAATWKAWTESPEKKALEDAEQARFLAAQDVAAGAPSAEVGGHLESLADAYRNTLSELRPFGGTRPAWDPDSNPTLAAAVNEAVSNHFPDDWIDAHNAANPVLLQDAHGLRAHYRPGNIYADPGTPEAAATLTTRASHTPGVEGLSNRASQYQAVTVHEFCHRSEDVLPSIVRIEEQFLARRTTDPATGEREPLQPLDGVGDGTEMVRPDKFVNAYIGKEYPGSSKRYGYTEVLSVGAESLFGGTNGGLVGGGRFARDDDMRALVLGIFAGVGHEAGKGDGDG